MPLPDFTLTEIKAILDTDKFGEFIGAFESDVFDAKSSPYRLDQELQKYELAKDVASFANADGGYIVIGLSTKPATIAATDIVTEVRPFDSALVDPMQYQDIVKQRIYPHISGLEARWRENKGTPGKGLLIIEIPPQREEDKYFLVNGVCDQGTRLPQTVFGVPIRRLSSNQSMPVAQLHHLVQEGRTIGAHLNRIEQKIGRLEQPKAAASRGAADNAIKRRLQRLMDEVHE